MKRTTSSTTRSNVMTLSVLGLSSCQGRLAEEVHGDRGPGRHQVPEHPGAVPAREDEQRAQQGGCPLTLRTGLRRFLPDFWGLPSFVCVFTGFCMALLGFSMDRAVRRGGKVGWRKDEEAIGRMSDPNSGPYKAYPWHRPLKNKSRLQVSVSLGQMSMGNNMGFLTDRIYNKLCRCEEVKAGLRFELHTFSI